MAGDERLLRRQYALCGCGHFAHGHQELTGACQARGFIGGKVTCGCREFALKVTEQADQGGGGVGLGGPAPETGGVAGTGGGGDARGPDDSPDLAGG